MRKTEIKIMRVIGHPEEIITTLTDLIIKGEVNVVLFNQYEKFFSPEELEEKLSKSININNGWETEYLYLDDERSGLKFHRQGEDKIEDVDVVDCVEEISPNIPHLFPDDMETQIEVVTKNYVKGILPELIEEGLSLEDITEDTDSMWDYVVELIGDLDEDVQKLIWFYDEMMDFTLWGFLYDELKTRIVMEMSNEVEC